MMSMLSTTQNLTRIRNTMLVTLLAAPASVMVSAPASAAPVLVDGCVNQNYLVPTGTVITADYTTCLGDFATPVLARIDVYDSTGNWLGEEAPTGSLPSVSFTPDETFNDLYANMSVAQASPFTTQVHVFIFSCGTDPLDYTTNVMDRSYNSNYITFSNTMPTTDLCSQSPASSVDAPQTFELALTTIGGTVCTRSSESGTAGTWITLLDSNECTPPSTKPNAKLLGWATSPDFPISIAKRQVDHGSGAYEIFNSDGQLSNVFIPAGGSTYVSAPGMLYAIWSE